MYRTDVGISSTTLLQGKDGYGLNYFGCVMEVEVMKDSALSFATLDHYGRLEPSKWVGLLLPVRHMAWFLSLRSTD